MKAVIFDFDGVLIDAEPVNVRAAVQTFANLGMPLKGEEIARIPGHPSKVFIPEFLTARGKPDSEFHKQVRENFLEYYFDLWPREARLPGDIDATLRFLKEKGLMLAIATTNLQRTVNLFFDTFGFRDLFSVIVTGEDVSRSKPDPEVYNLAAMKCGVSKEECVAVEDTDVGMQSAKNAGLKCIAIPTPYAPQMDFSSADYAVRNLGEMMKLEIWG